MAKINKLSRAQMIYTYIKASGFTVAKVAKKFGLSAEEYGRRLSEKSNNNRIVYETGKIIGVDLSFLVQERENGRDFRNG